MEDNVESAVQVKLQGGPKTRLYFRSSDLFIILDVLNRCTEAARHSISLEFFYSVNSMFWLITLFCKSDIYLSSSPPTMSLKFWKHSGYRYE